MMPAPARATGSARACRAHRAGSALALLVAAIAINASTGADAALPRESRVPGGVALIGVGDSTAARPSASSDGVPVWVSRRGAEWVAVVGLPLAATEGERQIEVRSADGVARTVRFAITAKHYPVQHVTLRDNAMVEPPAPVLARIEREAEHLKHLRSVWREAPSTSAAFVLPATGRLSGRFGGSRVLNGKPRAPHAGLDVAIPTGTTVVAPGDGIVLDVGDYYFCGKTMYIDHGNGLLSAFCHLSDWQVKAGDVVRQGQPVARSGATGRASGPHLHWSVMLNGTSVEPELFLPPMRSRKSPVLR